MTRGVRRELVWEAMAQLTKVGAPAAQRAQASAGRRALRPYALSSALLALYMFTVIAWSEASPLAARYSKLAGLALTFVFISEFLFRRAHRVTLPVETVALLGFLLWNYYSLLWAVLPAVGLVTVKTLGQLLLFWLVSVNIMTSYGSLTPVSVGLVAGIAWAIFSAIRANGMSLTPTGTTRVGSVLTNPNAYAMALTTGIIAAFYLFRQRSHLTKLVLVVLIILAVQQIFFFSGSRKGMLGAVAAPIIYFGVRAICSGRNRPQQFVVLFVGVVVGYFVFDWLLANAPFAQRLFNSREEASFVARQKLINVGLEQWVRAPLIGHGANQYRVLFQFDFGNEAYAHNNYIELLVNVGVIGTAIFYSVYLLMARRYLDPLFRRGATPDDMAWAATLLILFLLWDVAQVSYGSKLYWAMFAQLVAQHELVRRSAVAEAA